MATISIIHFIVMARKRRYLLRLVMASLRLENHCLE